MHPLAVAKASLLFNSASNSMRALRTVTDGDEAYVIYSDFLTAWVKIFTVLEKGSKTSAQSRQWFGKKKRDRRELGILQYFYQARNDDTHGLEPVIHITRGTAIFPVKEGEEYTVLEGRQIGLSLIDKDGNRVIPDRHTHCNITPSTVTTRDGTKLHPPISYKGEPIKDISIFGLTRIALDYSEEMIKEAVGLQDS